MHTLYTIYYITYIYIHYILYIYKCVYIYYKYIYMYTYYIVHILRHCHGLSMSKRQCFWKTRAVRLMESSRLKMHLGWGVPAGDAEGGHVGNLKRMIPYSKENKISWLENKSLT